VRNPVRWLYSRLGGQCGSRGEPLSLCKQEWCWGSRTWWKEAAVPQGRAVLPCRRASGVTRRRGCGGLGRLMAIHGFTTGSKMLLNHVAGGWRGGFPPGSSVSITLNFQLCFVGL